MDYPIEVVDHEEQPTAVIRATVSHDGIGPFLGQAFGEILAAVGGAAVVMPFARYDLVDEGFDVEAGFTVTSPIASPSGRVEASSLPAGPIATTMHVGPYGEVVGAYRAIEAWLPDHGWQMAGSPWETYLDGPEVPEPRTLVSWPCMPVVE